MRWIPILLIVRTIGQPNNRYNQKRTKQGGGIVYTTLKKVLQEADQLHMAIGAFNTHNLEMVPAIIRAASNQKTPVIVQTSEGTAAYVGMKTLVAVVTSLAGEYGVDAVLHLDHAKNWDTIRAAVDAGYSSVMYDGSALPFKENILGTKRVVEYAHAAGASVEAELGTVGGTEDGVVVHSDGVHLTDP
ncbi:MAG TPA: class II fructose-bisphosphate aldolase, partial [Atopobiaceae bacterium]|nr:class II fructose-bisphosphate aldolase [Atopobiaceae bacterium]